MKVFLLVALAALQEVEPPPPAKPWTGTLATGLAEMRKLSEEGKPDEALAIGDRILALTGFAKWREEATARPGWRRRLVEGAEPLLAAVGLSDRTSVERGAVHYARGVVLARAEKLGEAGMAFETARALAGPGELRLDATYDLAWSVLEEGEALRKQIPELGGTPPQPTQPAMPQLPGAPPPPDPLQLARAAYTLARDRFVERLRADASDPDSRANVELAQKRLKELDAIERKREEEKKKQEQQEKDKKDEEQKDQDQKDQKNDESKDPKQDDESDEQKKKDEQQKPPEEQPKPDEKKDEKKDAKPESSKEQLLTKEEIMRLLDTLKDREEEGKKLMERLKRANRARVKKDW